MPLRPWKYVLSVVFLTALFASFMTDAWAQKLNVPEETRIKFQLENITTRFTTQPLSSRLHAENIGRMVFSKSPIARQKPDRAALTTQFQGTDPIHARLYLVNSLANTPVYFPNTERPRTNQPLGYVIRLQVNGIFAGGEPTYAAGRTPTKIGTEWTTWALPLFKPGKSTRPSRFNQSWQRVIDNLTPGVHRMRLSLWGARGQARSRLPLSVGEFTYLKHGLAKNTTRFIKFPRIEKKQSSTNRLSKQIRTALIGTAVDRAEDLKSLHLQGTWKDGTYLDSKRQYQEIIATVQFTGTNKDGICRIASYRVHRVMTLRKTWSDPEYKTPCLACLAGEAQCAK